MKKDSSNKVITLPNGLRVFPYSKWRTYFWFVMVVAFFIAVWLYQVYMASKQPIPPEAAENAARDRPALPARR